MPYLTTSRTSQLRCSGFVTRALSSVRGAALIGVLAVLGSLLVPMPVATAAPGDPLGTRIASVSPAAYTPWVRDGQVLAIAQVGNLMVLGGNFTGASAPNTTAAVQSRTSVMALDAATGAIVPGFAPVLNGDVQSLLAGPVAGTVYVGGSFTTVNGVNRKSLTLLDLSTGQQVADWNSLFINGIVQDLALHGGRLVASGTFNKVGAAVRGGLASFHPSTGALDSWMTVNLTENHNWFTGSTGAKAGVGAENFDISPDGRTMVAIGNFRKANGVERRQITMIDLSGATPTVRTDWATQGFAATCSANSFDSYVRDIDFSPDGSYFVVVTTGGPFVGTLCDTATRWNTADTGLAITPVWTMVTGGDTLFSAAVTTAAVYVGGHNRWANNPLGRDRALGGAVPRPGVVALDPESGIPHAWNPGRNPRGIGTTALLATETGLWMGSDTDYIGINPRVRRSRIAYFPFATGTLPASDGRWTLPGNVYQGGPAAAGAPALTRYYHTGTGIAETTNVPTTIDWNAVRGGFVVDGTLFHGASDGLLYRRSFDGASIGSAQLIDPYLADPKWTGVSTGSGTTVYTGARPHFYGTELTRVTGMTFASDRIFYTATTGPASGSTTPATDATKLYWRWFNPESGIMSQDRFEVAGAVMPTNLRGMFAASGYLWYASGSGELSRRTLTGATLGGTTEVVGGPAVDGVDWRANALFAGPGPIPTGPGSIAFVAASTAQSNTTTATVALPAGTQEGDALVLFATVNSATSAPTAPVGWTEVRRQVSGTMLSVLWSKVAQAGEPSGVTVTQSTARIALQLATYTNTATGATSADGPVSTAASTADTSTATHVTPTVTVPDQASLVLSYWSDKSSSTTTWTPPASVTPRGSTFSTGSGYVTSLLADGGAPVGAGTSAGGLTATTNAPSARGTNWTVVLRPEAA